MRCACTVSFLLDPEAWYIPTSEPKKKYIYYFFQTTITLRFQMIYLWKQDLLSIVEIKPYTEKYIIYIEV